MTVVPLTYLSMDEIARGVGAVQVLPYVEALARRGVEVTLHSFERCAPTWALRRRLDDAGVAWHPHRFHGGGATPAVARVLHAAALVRDGTLVHARSDLAAAAAVLGRPDAWVWDIRSFWADQRIAMGMLGPRSAEERVLRRVESAAAAGSSAITTLTMRAIEVLAERHGGGVRAKATVIPTCVDLARFPLTPLPDAGRIRLLLSGSFNALYDLDVTMRFFRAMRRVRPTDVMLLRPDPSAWDRSVVDSGGTVVSASLGDVPVRVQSSHAGVCLCRTDVAAAISGAAPTKIAEFLATGRPIVVNAGLGDMDELVARHGCGVIVEDGSDDAIDRAAKDLDALLNDELTPTRCRLAAIEHFDLEQGVSRLLEVYHRVLVG